MTSHHYVYSDGAEFAVASFSEGVVALDVDAPTTFFYTPRGRALMLDRVHALARELSSEFFLGQYWVYQTGHGAHVLFESVLQGWDTVEQVLVSASERAGWHEDHGHVGVCRTMKQCNLRVGFKPGREWDIESCGNSSRSLPRHVREHDALVAQRLPAR